MDKKLLGYYNYTVILTYVGMIMGFLGVVFALEENLHNSLICLMLAGLCDMFDGAIASTRDRTFEEKCFGIQIDSLSDLICFGVLPSVIMSAINMKNKAAYAIGAMYVLCALIRLAYFNVSEQKRQELTSEAREVYQGLPVTTVAIILPVVLMLSEAMGWRREMASSLTLLIMGVLFLMPFHIKKPKVLGKIILLMSGLLSLCLLLIGVGDV